MNRWLRVAACGLALPLGAAHAQKDPDVGNITMDPKKTLLDNLKMSPLHHDLLSSLQAAGMEASLGGGGPYTVFAPTDDAFNRKVSGSSLPVAPVDTTQPARVLQYHVVQGKLTSKQLAKMVKHGKGTATIKTVAGESISVRKAGSIFILTDEKNGTAVITTPDVKVKNGYFHVVDAVLSPQ